MFEIIARIDDDAQALGRQDRSETRRELGAADAAA
jgi:hypothetical protein